VKYLGKFNGLPLTAGVPVTIFLPVRHFLPGEVVFYCACAAPQQSGA
jgi:hypothetical protein